MNGEAAESVPSGTMFSSYAFYLRIVPFLNTTWGYIITIERDVREEKIMVDTMRQKEEEREREDTTEDQALQGEHTLVITNVAN
jgi:hypothetical protein